MSSSTFRPATPHAATVIAMMSFLPVANADTAGAPDAPDAAVLPPIVVTAQHLDESRSKIQTQTGASTYTLDSAAIAAIPGGNNTMLNQVILQAPEVAQDSFGQFHIRGEPNGLQYRINGIILPEGIAVFGQALDPRLISSLSLVTGALPAEFGLRTAGIIDIKTKSGILAQGGGVAVYGGSHGEVEPSFVYGGGAGSFSYFVSADFLRSDLGIESPDGSVNPIHDHTTQYHGFGYFEDILDEMNRVALMLGSSLGQFQVPDLVGVQLLYTAHGISNFLSQHLNENQREVTQFGALRWQHAAGAFKMQTSFVARYSSLTFVPDQTGDIIVTGIAQDAYKQNVAYAAQSDGSFQLNDEHTVRAGLFLQSDHSVSDTNSFVLDTNDSGIPLSDTPVSIVDNGGKTEWIESAYLQDEWKMQENFTVNYGVRLDRFTAYTSASQASPRLNAVWQVVPDTTLHVGYSRYLSPPPFELVGGKDIGLFLNTSNPPLTPEATSPLPERANYYDFGVQQKFTAALTMGLDSYYKQSVNLIDKGQFGAPIIMTPFNDRFGKQEGVEWTTTYKSAGFSAYFNAAAQSARGKQIDSAQLNFSPTDLAYIAQNYIHLDHEQEFTGSGGYRTHGTRRASAPTSSRDRACGPTWNCLQVNQTALAAPIFRTASTCPITRKSTRV